MNGRDQKKLKSIFLYTTLIFLFLSPLCENWIPGMTFNSYKKEDRLDITVGRLNSIKTQFPFSYYYLPVCYNTESSKVAENLGEILTGDYTFTTRYEAYMKKDEYCKVLCKRKIESNYEEKIYEWMIEREYTSSWFLDSLPAGLNYTYKNGIHSDRVLHDFGIPIGEQFGIDTQAYIYNHLTFEIFVNNDSKSTNPFTIVEFNIIPWSINHETEEKTHCARNDQEFKARRNWQPDNRVFAKIGEEIIYTYDVIFYDSSMKWASRWDHLLKTSSEDNIHWLSFINSTLVILIFAALIGHIFFRSIRRDIDYINTRAISDDFFDDSSWKQVSNDLFRKPRYSMLLSVLVGTGIQLFAMIIVTMIIGTIGFLSPANRGSLLTMMLLLFVFMGGLAGYWSARFYKMFNQSQWLKTALVTAFFFPSLAFGIFILVNTFLIMEDSIGAVPFSTIVALLLLWLCCSSPLVLIGSFVAVKKKPLKNPGKINPVPTTIPSQPWYMETKIICLVSGLLPFLAIFIELVYVMGSIWKHAFHYVFGFILIVVIILLITSSEISMVLAYFQLSKYFIFTFRGDYRWWWKSYLVSGSVAIYIFAYSVYYYFNTLQMTRFSSFVLYFSYMFLGSAIAFLVTGSIGFVSTYFFLRKIYSMIKID